MKFLALVFCLVMSFANAAFADVTGEVVSIDKDSNGNIRVWTCHSIDGVEVESNYPKINGHYVYCTRYSKQNFLDCKDKTEIENLILNDIKSHTNSLVQKEFDKNAPKTFRQIRIDYNAQANQNFMDANLDKLIGKKVNATEFKRQIDTDNDGENDKEITLKTDGTYSISPVLIP